MIAHLVLMKPRGNLTAAERLAFVDAFERAVRTIPSVRGVHLGRRERHGAGYEQAPPDIDFAAVILFDDLSGLQTYLRHPAHADLGAQFGQAMASALVYDCEVGGVDDLRRWPIL